MEAFLDLPSLYVVVHGEARLELQRMEKCNHLNIVDHHIMMPLVCKRQIFDMPSDHIGSTHFFQTPVKVIFPTRNEWYYAIDHTDT